MVMTTFIMVYYKPLVPVAKLKHWCLILRIGYVFCLENLSWHILKFILRFSISLLIIEIIFTD